MLCWVGQDFPWLGLRLSIHRKRWLPTRSCFSSSVQSCPLQSKQPALTGRRGFVCLILSPRPQGCWHIWSEPRRILHCCMDQGSIGWPSNYFLYFHQKLRGWMFMDPSHRRYNNVLDALKDSCLAHLKHEMTICVNLGSAPWGSCGHFFRYKEAAA
jgi:hypothetical protein